MPNSSATPLQAIPLVPVFAVDRVVKRYGPVLAVDEVSLDFGRGATTALIGSSGSGKSTLLRLLLGLEWPDAGRVLIGGKTLDAKAVAALRQRVGYVIQEGGLFPHLTVSGNLALLPRHVGWSRQEISMRVSELADLTRMPASALTRFSAELSGGQRQRVALMRALMLDPEVLLMDEPLGSLDPIVRHELQVQLKRIFADLGKSVILVTHDLAEAAWFADRLVLMRNGRVVQDGNFRALRERPADPFVTRFIDAQRSLPDASA